MRSIFLINGTGILTLRDLQREFSPWDIYYNLANFVSFAKVHSKPLPVKVCKKEDGYSVWDDASFFGKSFWIDVLNIQDWENASDSIRQMRLFAEEAIFMKVGIKDKFSLTCDDIGIDKEKKKDQCANYTKEKSEMTTEYQCLKIEDKIEHIVKTAKLGNSAADVRTAIILLAICELSEINALDFSFSKTTQAEVHSTINANLDKTKAEYSAMAMESNKSDNKTENQIMEFPSTADISLLARDIPYKYWYHSSNMLEAGETIKTVCVHAKASNNRYASVIIEVYDEVSKLCIHTLVLAANEYRYCNVASGKLIKFLPTISMSPDAYLCRTDLTKPDITVCGEKTSAWTLSENNVSSFSVSDKEDGFVLVQKGKLNTVFYKKANDYVTKTMMSLIVDPVVEIQLTEDGYKVLTSKGETVSNIPSYTPDQNVVSLDRFSRLPMPKSELCKSEEMEEVSLGNNKDCMMIRSKNAKKNIVVFRNQGKHISVNGDERDGIIIIVK